MGLATKLRRIVDQSFEVSQETYAATLAVHNKVLGLEGDLAFRAEVRPKFFTGNPDALVPGGYLLALSLNHKYAPGPGISEELDALNAGPAKHYESCVNYFARYRTYRFYTNFLPVLRGMGFRAPELGQQIFFMDALPFFSVRSRMLSPAELRRMGGALIDLNRDAVRAVITEVQPGALFINGSTAFTALEAWSDGPVEWRRHVLAGKTSAGSCRVEIAKVSLFGVEVQAVRSNFLRSVYGPNSEEQCRELGSLLSPTESPASSSSVPASVTPPRAESPSLVQEVRVEETASPSSMDPSPVGLVMSKVSRDKPIGRREFEQALAAWARLAKPGAKIGGDGRGQNAWIHVRVDGRNYYMNADSTKAGVDRYLTLLANSPDLTWPLVMNQRGTKRNKVAFGPDEEKIPGFFFYVRA